MIPLPECVHGGLYRINSRNLRLGVFRQHSKGFVGIREKFGTHFLFEEYHWDTGEPFGTVCPQEFLEQCPLTELSENDWLSDNKELFDWLKKKEEQYPCLET
jgi:hypothetical protein